MICNHCKKEIEDSATICPFCEGEVSSEKSVEEKKAAPPPVKNVQTAKPEKNSKGKTVLIGLGIAAAVIVILVVLLPILFNVIGSLTSNNNNNECSHQWAFATCEMPEHCINCGITNGSALGHNYDFNSGVCVNCGVSDPNFVNANANANNNNNNNNNNNSNNTPTNPPQTQSSEIKVSDIEFPQDSASIHIGDTFTIGYVITPSNATNKTLTWTSNNPNVATVSSSGVIKGIGSGKAMITAKAANGYTTAYFHVTVSEDLISQCKLNLPTVPITLNHYGYDDKVQSTTKVTGIRYVIKENSDDGTVDVELYFSGEKTYDENGAGQSDSCKISWKLYDAEGYVVESETVYTTAVKPGEKYKDCKETIYDLAPGTYTLEILNTN